MKYFQVQAPRFTLTFYNIVGSISFSHMYDDIYRPRQGESTRNSRYLFNVRRDKKEQKKNMTWYDIR